MEIKAGDIVRMLSGGPDMLVEHVEIDYLTDKPTGRIICSHGTFRVKVEKGAVEKIEPPLF